MDKVFAQAELNYASINRLSVMVFIIVRKMIIPMKKIVSYSFLYLFNIQNNSSTEYLNSTDEMALKKSRYYLEFPRSFYYILGRQS